ncbi:ABC transporter ATP-binding protein [Eisenibacter elegans]|jgi:ATP-binding cassette subfamily B protein|uniref:ABC transporter ATP-binding protein n=1 Tax=Eisenibacter elegans TaxID=997 RepID=UPI00040FB2EB|nr:ABC transporter ATP-binding protein [Eisenibacter elegans]
MAKREKVRPEQPATDAPNWRESLEALRLIVPFLKMVWQASPSLAGAHMFLRLCKSGLPLAILWVGKLIIDEVVRLSPQADWTQATALWQWVILEAVLVACSELLNRAITLTDALLGDLFANQSSVQLMEHSGRLDLAQLEDAVFYDKLERARRQTVGRTVLMGQVFGQVQELVTVVFLLGGLWAFSPWLVGLLLLAVMPAFWNENYFNRYGYSLARSWTPERRELDYLRYIGASDETAKEVKNFGLSEFITARFQHLAHNYYLANRALAIRRAAWGMLFSLLTLLAYYGAYLVILIAALGGSISIGTLTFLAGAFSQMQTLLQGILSRFSAMTQSALYLQDLFDFLAIAPTMPAEGDFLPLPQQIDEGFVFENVGFCYPNSDIWALRGVSFTLKAGEKLALVGENGAGKTTLIKLLTRLYDPSEGRILLDGIDIRRYQPDAYRALIGVIFQDFVRFQLNAAENIAVGKIEARTEQPRIENAAQRSLADEVIEHLPQGYSQRLGKRFDQGVDLSGGQWQKIALARAYMRDAPVLVLDEPTAALDARAEYEVFVRFTELTKGKTAVLISHRFSTVRMADRILVLRKGSPVELGSHEALLAQNGLYAELFQMQAQGYQ